MKKTINGEVIEGSPAEIVEYEKLLNRQVPTNTTPASKTNGAVDASPKHHNYRPVVVGWRENEVLLIARQWPEGITSNEMGNLVDWGTVCIDSVEARTYRASSAFNTLKGKKLVYSPAGTRKWFVTDLGMYCPLKIKSANPQ